MDKSLLDGVGVFVPVSDLATSTKWYREMFGFELIHQNEPEANVFKMGNRIVTFCLVKSDEIEQPTFPRNNYSVEHYFNFHTTDVDKAHQYFIDKGANVSKIHQYDSLRGFNLYDLDENEFGVVG